MIAFTVPGCPVPKERARTVRTRSGRVVSFTPDRTLEYAEKVQTCFAAARRGAPKLTGPVEATLTFFLPDRRRRDWDNLGKAVCDALNELAYDDDSAIEHADVWKRYDQPDSPRAVVTLRPLVFGESGVA